MYLKEMEKNVKKTIHIPSSMVRLEENIVDYDSIGEIIVDLRFRVHHKSQLQRSHAHAESVIVCA
jgi:hypothetical protein